MRQNVSSHIHILAARSVTVGRRGISHMSVNWRIAEVSNEVMPQRLTSQWPRDARVTQSRTALWHNDISCLSYNSTCSYLVAVPQIIFTCRERAKMNVSTTISIFTLHVHEKSTIHQWNGRLGTGVNSEPSGSTAAAACCHRESQYQR